MKRLIWGVMLILTVFTAESVSAQLKTSYFMEGSYFRTEMNPALKPTRGYIALPLVSGWSGGMYSNVDMNNNPFTGLSNGNVDNMTLGNLPQASLSNISSSVNVLGVGFYNKKQMFWNFGINLRQDMDVAMSKDVYKCMQSTANGSYSFDKLNVDVNTYFDAYLGTAFSIGKHVTLGVRAKLIMGLTNLRYDIESCKVVNGSLESVSGTMHMWTPENDSSGNTVLDDAGVWRNMNSFGGALDLGVEVSLLKDHLKVSAAVTDLGFVRWSKTSGVEVPLYEDADLGECYVWTGYTTRMTCKLNVGVEYNFCKNHFAIGLLSHTRFYQSGVAQELTASFNIRPTNWMTLTASHTFLNGNKPGVFGAAINIHPCGINIFAGMDYVGKEYVGTGLHPFQLFAVDQEFMMPRQAKSMKMSTLVWASTLLVQSLCVRQRRSSQRVENNR